MHRMHSIPGWVAEMTFQPYLNALLALTPYVLYVRCVHFVQAQTDVWTTPGTSAIPVHCTLRQVLAAHHLQLRALESQPL